MKNSSGLKYIVGIDEVGRGPLAGPVTVGVVVCETELYKKLKRDKIPRMPLCMQNQIQRGILGITHLDLPVAGKDSKKLSPQAREKYAKVLKSFVSRVILDIAVVHISNKVIDHIGISCAIKKAIGQGIKKLKLNPKNCEVRLDGGLHAPAEFKNQKTIIKGDEKEKIIAWASILAKVSRDAMMCKVGKKYPQYGFEIHKGYGTARHLAAISTHGLSPLHRKSFCKNIRLRILKK